MKKSKIFVALLMSSVFLVSGCNNTSKSAPKGIDITSEGNITSLFETETLQLTAKVFPEDAVQTVIWSSTDANKATVSETGLVTGVDEGNVFIVATSTEDEKIKQEYPLTIKEKAAEAIKPTSITLKATGDAQSLKIGENLKLSVVVSPEEASRDVVWSSSADAIATVSNTGVVKGISEGKVTITATSVADENIKGTLDLQVELGTVDVTKEWSEMNFSTHDSYMNDENDTPLKVKGKVTYVTPDNNGKVNYYLQNGTEGYYIYEQNSSAFPVELGKCYEVGGFKKYYNGTREIINVEYFKESTETFDYSVSDVSALNITDDSAMSPYHSSWVKIDGAMIESKPTNWTKAFSINVKVGENAIAYRIDPKNMTNAEFTNLATKFQTLPVNSSINVTGIMSAFGYGKPANQVQIMRADDVVVGEMKPEDYINATADSITLPNCVDTNTSSIVLPSSIEGFDGVSIEWTSDNPAIAKDGKVTTPTNMVDVNLTAKLSYNEISIDRTFVVTVFGTEDNNMNSVHTLDLEDALPASESSYGCSATKPSYDDKNKNEVTLGKPEAATWYLRNALIGGDGNDCKNGTFSIRTQSNKVQESSGRIEVRKDFSFDILEFKAAIYGSNALGTRLMISYSTDSGATWVDMEREYPINTRSFETIRVKMPSSTNIRVAINVVANSGQRINVDDIRFLEAA